MSSNYRSLTKLSAADWWQAARLGSLPILDVRSPGEFAKGAVPGAQNTPLFSDEERSVVGTTYKQIGRIPAIQAGLEILGSRVDQRCDAWLRTLGGNREFAIYCARGGMRSYSVAIFLASLGLKPVILEGGYKSFRGLALQLIHELAAKELLVVVGCTGVGKTLLIRKITGMFPCIDLEGLANHRGSAFGDLNQTAPPPTQQNFENRLAEDYLVQRHNSRFVFELEDAIGPVRVPPPLKQKLRTAPMLELTAQRSVRITRIRDEYLGKSSHGLEQLILERLAMLSKHINHTERDRIANAVESHDIESAIEQLLELRYDKMYLRSLTRHRQRIVATIDCSSNFDEATKFISGFMEA